VGDGLSREHRVEFGIPVVDKLINSVISTLFAEHAAHRCLPTYDCFTEGFDAMRD
jgi:hypothetical protein